MAAGEEGRDGVAGDDDVVVVAWPALPRGDDLMAAGADDALGVDAAAVVVARCADGLVMHRDEGAVDNPRRAMAIGVGCVSGSTGGGTRWWMMRSTAY